MEFCWGIRNERREALVAALYATRVAPVPCQPRAPATKRWISQNSFLIPSLASGSVLSICVPCCLTAWGLVRVGSSVRAFQDWVSVSCGFSRLDSQNKKDENIGLPRRSRCGGRFEWPTSVGCPAAGPRGRVSAHPASRRGCFRVRPSVGGNASL